PLRAELGGGEAGPPDRRGRKRVRGPAGRSAAPPVGPVGRRRRDRAGPPPAGRARRTARPLRRRGRPAWQRSVTWLSITFFIDIGRRTVYSYACALCILEPA